MLRLITSHVSVIKMGLNEPQKAPLLYRHTANTGVQTYRDCLVTTLDTELCLRAWLATHRRAAVSTVQPLGAALIARQSLAGSATRQITPSLQATASGITYQSTLSPSQQLSRRRTVSKCCQAQIKNGARLKNK